MQFASFLLFTGLVALISYLKSKETNIDTLDGYYLGGRSLTGFVIAGSLLLTNLSTEQIVGLNGASFKEGILVMAWETLAAIALAVTAIFILPRYLHYGLSTIPEFLENRYDKKTRTIASVLFLTGYAVILLPVVLYSGSIALNTMFDVQELLGVSQNTAIWLIVWCLGLIGSVYAIFGGLKAVAVSDTVNAIGLLVGGLLIPFFGLLAIGEGSISNGVELLFQNNADKFNIVGDKDASVPFATLFTGMMLVQLFYWGTNQAIIQRALGAKNLVEGQKGLIYAAFIKLLGPLIVVLPGIIAFHLYGNSLSNADLAYPHLVKHVLPPVVLGFFAAVLFGAILSSFNSALNSSVTLFGLGVYKAYINKTANEVQTVKAGKRFGLGLALVSMLIAPLLIYASDGLFAYLQEVNGIYSIPILSVILVAFFTKKVPPIAARFGLLFGCLMYILSQFILKPLVFGEKDHPHFLHIMAVLFVVNVVIMLLIGHFRPSTYSFKNSDVRIVDTTPWRLTKPLAALVVFLVLLSYVIFS